MSKTTSNKRWMVQSLLRMAEITEDETKRSEYLQEVEEIMTEMKEIEELTAYNNTVTKGSVQIFCDVIGEKEFIGKTLDDVYQDYKVFCQSNSYRIVYKAEFSKQVQNYLSLETHRKRVGGNQKQMFFRVVEE